MKILPIWQPLGFSTHLISQRVGEKYGVKTSHTGTLDPMAKGVIIVLLGEERLKKYEYAKWLKNYEFEIVFGISTDSYDGLGLINKLNIPKTIDHTKLKVLLNSFLGEYKQTVPPLSTKKIKGRHLYEYFRAKVEVDLPEIRGEINKLELIDLYQEKTENIVGNIVKNITLVTGDFRQELIIENWRKLLRGKYLPESVTVAKISTETTKGIYIRSLVEDISKEMGTTGFAYSIVRTKNGKYGRNNCKSMGEIFGKNFKNVNDFQSKYKITMVK